MHIAASSARQNVPYQLFTHCGVQFVDYGGTRYYADPPNPPGQWGNPFDNGTLTESGQGIVLFTDPAGNSATFSTNPSSGVPTIQPCD